MIVFENDKVMLVWIHLYGKYLIFLCFNCIFNKMQLFADNIILKLGFYSSHGISVRESVA